MYCFVDLQFNHRNMSRAAAMKQYLFDGSHIYTSLPRVSNNKQYESVAQNVTEIKRHIHNREPVIVLWKLTRKSRKGWCVLKTPRRRFRKTFGPVLCLRTNAFNAQFVICIIKNLGIVDLAH